jgi:hypothetical protein
VTGEEDELARQVDEAVAEASEATGYGVLRMGDVAGFEPGDGFKLDASFTMASRIEFLSAYATFGSGLEPVIVLWVTGNANSPEAPPREAKVVMPLGSAIEFLANLTRVVEAAADIHLQPPPDDR